MKLRFLAVLALTLPLSAQTPTPTPTPTPTATPTPTPFPLPTGIPQLTIQGKTFIGGVAGTAVSIGTDTGWGAWIGGDGQAAIGLDYSYPFRITDDVTGDGLYGFNVNDGYLYSRGININNGYFSVDASGQVSAAGESFYINSTGNIFAPALTLTNGSSIQIGTTDTGGAGGISLVCAVGYPLNWQAGVLQAYESDGTTPRSIFFQNSNAYVEADGSVHSSNFVGDCSNTSGNAPYLSVGNADYAGSAGHANTADSADTTGSASYATEAAFATNADQASVGTQAAGAFFANFGGVGLWDIAANGDATFNNLNVYSQLSFIQLVATQVSLNEDGSGIIGGLSLGNGGSDTTLAAGAVYDNGYAQGGSTILQGGLADGQGNTDNVFGGNAYVRGGISQNTGAGPVFPGKAIVGDTHTSAVEIGETTIGTTVKGDVTFNRSVYEASSTRSGAGAIPLTHSVCKLTSTGASQSITLANGSDGQKLTVVHAVDGGSMVLTATTKTGWTTSITFTNAGDNCVFQYFTTIGWVVLSSRGATVL